MWWCVCVCVTHSRGVDVWVQCVTFQAHEGQMGSLGRRLWGSVGFTKTTWQSKSAFLFSFQQWRPHIWANKELPFAICVLLASSPSTVRGLWSVLFWNSICSTFCSPKYISHMSVCTSVCVCGCVYTFSLPVPLDPWIVGALCSWRHVSSVSGDQAVSGGNQQVDQSARGLAAVQGTGRQVPHGSKVRRPPSHRVVPQLQGTYGAPSRHWWATRGSPEIMSFVVQQKTAAQLHQNIRFYQKNKIKTSEEGAAQNPNGNFLIF